MRVKKAIIPAAGFGTRVLPASKSVPKEMLPVFDRPAIAHIAEEAWAAGIEHLIFIVGRNKSAIEDYFDTAFELEAALERDGKHDLLEHLRETSPREGSVSFVRQKAARGLGHAVWCARHLVGDEPVAVMLPDMLMLGQTPCLAEMVGLVGDGENVLSVQEVPWSDVSRYGIVEVARDGRSRLKMLSMVEKPSRDRAPSNLMISGRYILQPEIFGLLENEAPGAGGEIQLTDAMGKLTVQQPFFAHTFNGRTFDTGSVQGLLHASCAFALANDAAGMIAREVIEDALASVGRIS